MSDYTDFLLVSAAPVSHEVWREACAQTSSSLVIASSFDEAVRQIDGLRLKYVFIDLDNSALHPLQILEWIQTRLVTAKVVALTQGQDGKDLASALKLGAENILFGFLHPHAMALAAQLRELLLKLDVMAGLTRREIISKQGHKFVWVGAHSIISQLWQRAQALAQFPDPVFITGERGTGKKQFARILGCQDQHTESLELDAAQIPAEAQRTHLEKQLQEFKQINLSQDKICRILIFSAERLSQAVFEFMKESLFPVLEQTEETTRNQQIGWVLTSSLSLEDLRLKTGMNELLVPILNKQKIHLPPLRDRLEDLPVLVEHFIAELSPQRNRYLSRDALSALSSYHWPENVTELRRVIDSVIQNEKLNMVSARTLPAEILQQSFYRPKPVGEDMSEYSYFEAKKRVLNNFTGAYIASLLDKSGQNLTVAAEKAGMDRSNFKKLMKKFGLD